MFGICKTYTAIMFGLLFKLRQRWFAFFMTGFSQYYDAATHEEKVKLFAKLNTQVSQIPEYRKNGSLRILELGAGSGCNLKYYPKCTLIVVDPNLFFEKEFRKNLAEFPQISLEAYIGAYAENMKEFIEDNSIDAVVVTAVGCSVLDIQQFYKEVKRVLIPGGKFYYMEHILGKPGTWSYYKQKIMAAIRIWPFINCNCHVDRDLDYQVTLAGFKDIDQHLFEMDTSLHIGCHFISPHVSGIATK